MSGRKLIAEYWDTDAVITGDCNPKQEFKTYQEWCIENGEEEEFSIEHFEDYIDWLNEQETQSWNEDRALNSLDNEEDL
jgi:hypothetical protein